MEYIPKLYDALNYEAGTYSPSNIKPYNNEAYIFWCRALFQRAQSKLGIRNWPTEWNGLGVKDFFYYILLRQGYVGFYEEDGQKWFGFCTIGNTINRFYQPTKAIFSIPGNMSHTITREINRDCAVAKLCPDYLGIYDIVKYYAEQLALGSTSVNTSIINSKLAYILGAKTKGAAEALKRIFDKIHKGDASAVYDTRIQDDPVSKSEPFQRVKLFSGTDYITDKLLAGQQTIIDQFDAEIGIMTIPYNKKERMVESEAESKSEDSGARINLWVDTLNESFKLVNDMYGLNLQAYIKNTGKEDAADGKDNSVRNGSMASERE